MNSLLRAKPAWKRPCPTQSLSQSKWQLPGQCMSTGSPPPRLLRPSRNGFLHPVLPHCSDSHFWRAFLRNCSSWWWGNELHFQNSPRRERPSFKARISGCPAQQMKAYMESECVVDHSQGGRFSPQNRSGAGQREDSVGPIACPFPLSCLQTWKELDQARVYYYWKGLALQVRTCKIYHGSQWGLGLLEHGAICPSIPITPIVPIRLTNSRLKKKRMIWFLCEFVCVCVCECLYVSLCRCIWECLCVCVCVWVCVFVCRWVWACEYLCVCLCVCECGFVNICVCAFVSVHVYDCVCMCLYMWVCVNVCVYVCESVFVCVLVCVYECICECV